jgi:hypothetical protein
LGVTYRIFLERDVHDARDSLPGNVRQRMRRTIASLANDPRPSGSQVLDTTGLDVPAGIEVRRFRLDPWRLVYAIHDAEAWVWLLALRRRPPYDYDDLAALVDRMTTRS